MDRFTRQAYANKTSTPYVWRIVDRFRLRETHPGFVSVGYTYDHLDRHTWEEEPRVPRCHTEHDVDIRLLRLNDGHLKAWTETNYPQVVEEYEEKNKTATVPWVFKAFVRIRYPHALKRFAADTKRRINEAK